MEKRTKLIMSQVMLPSQANVAGNVHGGEIMKLMDTAAGAVARTGLISKTAPKYSCGKIQRL